MKAVVFGSNGYIGMHLVDQLNKLQWYVDAYDIQPSSVVNVHRYTSIDIRQKSIVEKINLDVDIVFFFSGLTGTGVAYHKYEDFIDINEKGLLHVLDAMRTQGSKARIIFPSTRLIYKERKATPIPEDGDKEFKSIYALNKHFSEQVLEQYAKYFGISYTIFRICVPYGNDLSQNYSYGTLGFFISKASSGKNITLYGDGSQARTFSYVGDICRSVINVSMMSNSKNQVFNIGGESYSLRDVAEMTAHKFGVEVEYVEWPELEKKMESGDTIFDSTKIEQLIGRIQSVQMETWIKKLKL